MEHHLETVSMGVIDQSVMKHVIYSDSDHSIINFLLHTDVCSLGLNFMHRPYEQYDICLLYTSSHLVFGLFSTLHL